MIVDPIEDAERILNESPPKNKICNSLYSSTVSNYTNSSITTNNKIILSNIFSVRLKSASRIIVSELERILYIHVLIK